MSYTTHEYLNRMISIAIEDGIITDNDVVKIIDAHGSNDDEIAIDILSMVYQRRKDTVVLKEMQRIYRRGLH